MRLYLAIPFTAAPVDDVRYNGGMCEYATDTFLSVGGLLIVAGILMMHIQSSLDIGGNLVGELFLSGVLCIIASFVCRLA